MRLLTCAISLWQLRFQKSLLASKGAKTLTVRKGDTIRIMRGDHKGFEGKISRVDLKNYRIYVEGLTREKVDGTTIFVPVHPSKAMIRNLNLDDKWRREILEAKKKSLKKLKFPKNNGQSLWGGYLDKPCTSAPS